MIRPETLPAIYYSNDLLSGSFTDFIKPLILLSIFLLIVFFISAAQNFHASPKKLLPVLSAAFVFGIGIIVCCGTLIEQIKGMLLFCILLSAVLSDLRTRKVTDSISIMLLILSFVGFEAANLPSMLIGAMIVFIPQFALAIIRPSRACGGADLKISTALAFMLGAGKGVFALIIGMLLAVIVMAIYNKVNAKDQKEAFPLVPFLSVGAMLAYII